MAKKKRRYSRSAGSDVENEMQRYKKRTAKSGRGRERRQSEKPKAGHCDRTVEGT